MVGESINYKEHLLQFATKLRRWHSTNRWSEKRLIEYEKEVFLCFFYIRKLIEGKRLTDEVEKKKLSLLYYKPMRTVHRVNSNSVEKLYDFDTHQHTSLPLVSFCNQVIHSYVFQICYGHGESFILVSSDYKRNEVAYRLDYAELINILEIVARDDANFCVKGQWNDEKMDYDFIFSNKTDD